MLQPVVGQPDDPELALVLEAARRTSSGSAPRRCAAGRARGERDEAEREQREVPRRSASCRWYVRPSARITSDDHTALLWFRRDLRLADHPALTRAAREFDRVVPVFVLDDALLHGPLRVGAAGGVHARLPARARRGAARARQRPRRAPAGGPARELVALAGEVGAARCCGRATSRRTPARATGGSTRRCATAGVEPLPQPGRLTSSTSPSRARRAARRSPSSPRSPALAHARAPHGAPRAGRARAAAERAAQGAAAGGRTRSGSRTTSPSRSASRARPPRARRCRAGSTARSTRYAERHDASPRAGTSGAVAVPALGLPVGGRVRGARRAPRRRGRRRRGSASSAGATSTPTSCCPPRQRAPRVPGRYRDLEWEDDDEAFDAWREGRTGYPLVDAGDAPARAHAAGCTTARGSSSARF